MQKSQREKAALRQLKTEETELQLRLTQIRKALAVLEGTRSEPTPTRPECRADLLRKYLVEHPEGVRLKDVPAVLHAIGHVSFAGHPTTNWLYQLKPEKAYFVIKDGVVTLRVGCSNGAQVGSMDLFQVAFDNNPKPTEQPPAKAPITCAGHEDNNLTDAA